MRATKASQGLKFLKGFCSLYLRYLQKDVCALPVISENENILLKSVHPFFVLCDVKSKSICMFLCHFKLTSPGRNVNQMTNCSYYPWRLLLRCTFFQCWRSNPGPCTESQAAELQPTPTTAFNYPSGDVITLWVLKWSLSVLLALNLLW